MIYNQENMNGIDLFYTCQKKNKTIVNQVNQIIEKNNFSTSVSIPIQKHTDKVIFTDSPNIYDSCDGIISNLKFSLVLSLSVADCVPICIYDPNTKNYGLVHSGWKGTSKAICNKAIMLMKENGSKTSDIRVYLGPSISQSNYKVDEDVAMLFSNINCVKSGNKFLLDLKSQITDDLISVGIKQKNISSSSICTYSNLDFPSYRRDGEKTGRIIFLMGHLHG